MIVQFIGTWISGGLLFRVFAFAFFAISKIRIPVSPPETTPPIPRISAKLMKLNWVIVIYRIKGAREVNVKFFRFDIFRSYLKVSRRENDRTK